MAFISNDAVLARTVPWDSYAKNNLISDADLVAIRRVDKNTDTAVASALAEMAPDVFAALFNVLRNVSAPETTQYALALLDTLLLLEPARAREVRACGQASPSAPAPAVTLARLLSLPDWFTQAKAAKILGKALDAAPGGGDADGVVSTLLDWAAAQLSRPSERAGEEPALAATGAMATLLRRRELRAQGMAYVSLLVAALKRALATSSTVRAQTLYHAGVCLWLLTFEDGGAAELVRKGAVAPLIELLKEGNKEKVMRIALMALQRTLVGGGEAAEAEAVDAGLPRLVRIRSAQAWSDEDVPDLLEKLDATLGRSVAALSSWEKYRAEALGGALDWTPMHKSATFWQENIERFEEKDWQVLRVLIQLLQTTTDARVAAVACSDLAHFADAHPHGRYIVNDLGGKPAVMARMADADGEVAKHALLCVQRLMLGRDKLDVLRRPPGGAAAAAGPSSGTVAA